MKTLIKTLLILAVLITGANSFAGQIGQNASCVPDDTESEIKGKLKKFAEPSNKSANKVLKNLEGFSDYLDEQADEIEDMTCSNVNEIYSKHSELVGSVKDHGKVLRKFAPKAREDIREVKQELLTVAPRKTDVISKLKKECDTVLNDEPEAKVSSILNEDGLDSLYDELIDLAEDNEEKLSGDSSAHGIREKYLTPHYANAMKCIALARQKKAQKQQQWAQYAGMLGSIMATNTYGSNGSMMFGQPYGGYMYPGMNYGFQAPNMYAMNRGFYNPYAYQQPYQVPYAPMGSWSMGK
ncbi:MAG: hypothetical protein CME70_03315 [Halobacteriovorax sp.]|nr:hypothetical protein [Halobacteriovorax sp.]MBK23013.1 hypothetical protein [Halobacteriovorax sp.]|tara:strand:- start:58852 stop:59739 length:888 start_codon:yes stop_codon:yes gene_type:complete